MNLDPSGLGQGIVIPVFTIIHPLHRRFNRFLALRMDDGSYVCDDYAISDLLVKLYHMFYSSKMHGNDLSVIHIYPLIYSKDLTF